MYTIGMLSRSKSVYTELLAIALALPDMTKDGYFPFFASLSLRVR